MGPTPPTGRSQRNMTPFAWGGLLRNTMAGHHCRCPHCSFCQSISRASPAATRCRGTHSTKYRPCRPTADGPNGLAAKEGRVPSSYRQGTHACSHARIIPLYVSLCIRANDKLKYLADKGGFAGPDLLPPRPPDDAVGVGCPLSRCEEPVSLRSGANCH